MKALGPDIGRYGLWSGPLRRGDRSAAVDAATRIEALGFRCAWMPGGEEDLEGHLRALLDATEHLIFALAIVNIWWHPPREIARMYDVLRRRYGERVLIGVGVGHAPLVNQIKPDLYRRPLASTAQYLDELDAVEPSVPLARRFVAAFSERMLALARDRSLGAVPYLTTPEHTRWARRILGPDALLVAEQHVVLEDDPEAARRIGREYLATYLGLPNYLNNFRRMGLSDVDFAGGGSDRMVDTLIAWGGVQPAIARCEEHLAAGADHVGIQVLTPQRSGFPLESWGRLAAALPRSLAR